MKLRSILVNGLIVAATLFCITGCVENKNETNVYAYNKKTFDTEYYFDTAIIDLHNEVIVVDVKNWTDYEDCEQLQIVAQDGTVYLTSSYNCTLIKTKQGENDG